MFVGVCTNVHQQGGGRTGLAERWIRFVATSLGIEGSIPDGRKHVPTWARCTVGFVEQGYAELNRVELYLFWQRRFELNYYELN